MFTCKKAPLAAAAALVVVGLAGCLGGGGGSSTPVTPAKVASNGAMVDGLVAGADVYCDLNGNGVGDATEPKTTTDPKGNYKFDDCNAGIVGSGGTNTDTGFKFTGQLKSPAGATFMTPLTTLVSGTGLTTSQLATMLSAKDGTDPTKQDPLADVELYKRTLAVQQVMAQLAATLKAAGSTLSEAEIYGKVGSSLAGALKDAKAPLISATGGLNADLLVAAVLSAAKSAGAAVSDADAKAMASAVKSQAEQFMALTSLADLANAAKKLQDPNNPDLKIDPSAGTKFFALDADSITVDAQPVTLTQLQSANGVVLSSFDKINVKLNVNGAPAVGTSALALELVEQGGAARVMRVALDKANFSLANGQLGLSIPTDAKVYLYGRKAKDGAEVTYGGPLGTAKKPLTFSAGNVLTIDYSAIVNRVLEAQASDQSNAPTLSSFLAVKGTFKLTAVISSFNLRKANGDALPQIELKATPASPTVYGSGISGLITVN
jgi:hypothetical protein